MDFETLTRRTVEVLEDWDGADLGSIELAAEALEELVCRAPEQLPSLAELPQSEGVGLWLHLTSLGNNVGTHLIGAIKTGEIDDRSDRIIVEQRRLVREAVRRVQRATTCLVRITNERARSARRAHCLSPASPPRLAS